MIPDRVQVGPHRFQVRTDDDTAKKLRVDGRRGDTSSDDQIIRIDPDRPHTGVADTLLHEVLHAVWDQTSLRTSENLTDHEEAVVVALASPLLGVLRDNPDLVAFLTRTDPS